MQRIGLLIVAGLSAVALVACGGRPAPVTTAVPQPNADSLARAREDSIAQAEAAARAQAEAAARRRADSLAALQQTAEEVPAELASMIHYDFDKAIIRSGDALLLDRKVPLLPVNPALRLRIAGNCDERGSDEYNLALGNRRAIAARSTSWAMVSTAVGSKSCPTLKSGRSIRGTTKRLGRRIGATSSRS